MGDGADASINAMLRRWAPDWYPGLGNFTGQASDFRPVPRAQPRTQTIGYSTSMGNGPPTTVRNSQWFAGTQTYPVLRPHLVGTPLKPTNRNSAAQDAQGGGGQ
jgi:hypothetical protein